MRFGAGVAVTTLLPMSMRPTYGRTMSPFGGSGSMVRKSSNTLSAATGSWATPEAFHHRISTGLMVIGGSGFSKCSICVTST